MSLFINLSVTVINSVTEQKKKKSTGCSWPNLAVHIVTCAGSGQPVWPGDAFGAIWLSVLQPQHSSRAAASKEKREAEKKLFAS